MTPTLLAKATVTVILMFPPNYYEREPKAEHDSRLTMIGTELSAEIARQSFADKIGLTAVALMTGSEESGYALRIHDHKCWVHKGECDGGRAKSPWQFQRTSLVKAEWDGYKGRDVESTRLAAKAVVRLLIKAFNSCQTWEGAIAWYATGKGCKWSGASNRARKAEALTGKLKSAMKP